MSPHASKAGASFLAISLITLVFYLTLSMAGGHWLGFQPSWPSNLPTVDGTPQAVEP